MVQTDLRRRIGRVEIAVRGDALRDVRIDDAGLDHDALVGNVDVEDAVHAGEADDDAALGGERASAEAGAGATADEGNLVPGADTNDGLHLLSVRGSTTAAGRTRKLVRPSHS